MGFAGWRLGRIFVGQRACPGHGQQSEQPCRSHGGRPTGRRRVIFLGDLVGPGPASPAVLRLVMGMVSGGQAGAAANIGCSPVVCGACDPTSGGAK